MENSWISTECFFTWLSNLFHSAVRESVSFPIIIFLDGHWSHVNISVSEFCFYHDIILYLLPPHSSHIIQTLDITCFGPLKKRWNAKLDEFKAKNGIFLLFLIKHSKMLQIKSMQSEALGMLVWYHLIQMLWNTK